MTLDEAGISKLEAEPQEGPTEYKLHLLLRPRRRFISTSTGSQVSGSHHSKPFLTGTGARVYSSSLPHRPAVPPSNLTRQARLQQLTTQLLWRLQQSSPFHSSSSANLVAPLLPEATITLDVPAKPGKLLPGLEESQGALYEIGVSDDGTFVGLVEDELDESLTNLEAMAASLGCVVEVLRRVAVGECEWVEVRWHSTGDGGDERELRLPHKDTLWVAEALVRPDLNASAQSVRTLSSPAILAKAKLKDATRPAAEVPRSKTEQLRVSITGSSTSGKSSLLGTLTTSTSDNGRGKSRLSLLKHRHEIASGVTSSIAQELIGYTDSVSPSDAASSAIINYASEDVASWPDIHDHSDRLVFLSDSPGLSKFSKSIIRTLTAWQPHWTIVCAAADSENNTAISAIHNSTDAGADVSISHLDLCLKLDLQIVVAVTKMDLASKTGLRQTLARLLTVLKSAGRKPMMLNASTTFTSTGLTGQVPDHLSNLEEMPLDAPSISVTDENEAQRIKAAMEHDGKNVVPILLTSSVTGTGIGQLHGLLRRLPVSIPNTNAHHNSSQDEEPTSKIFHVDEVFALPPSKVYSHSQREEDNSGVVLCGRHASGTLAIGDELLLGPFSTQRSPVPSQHPHEPLSLRTIDTTYSAANGGNTYERVHVISIRNLRLPVRTLLAGQVGTVGISNPSSPPHFSLRRARRGMVLLAPSPHLIPAYSSFTAIFPGSDFGATTSPALILGGHALVYANTVRAAVKVVAVALDESSCSDPPSPADLFSFDDVENASLKEQERGDEIKITFRFVSTVEWMQRGDKVLVVPNMAAAGPVSGPTAASSGLSGFVGRVVEGFG